MIFKSSDLKGAKDWYSARMLYLSLCLSCPKIAWLGLVLLPKVLPCKTLLEEQEGVDPHRQQ